MKPEPYQFSLLHIDIARNATDDFNPFHDKMKWANIVGNPYQGPIVLGFQLLALIAQNIAVHRKENDENAMIKSQSLGYSCYQLNFASAVKPGDQIAVEIRKTRRQEGVLTNRLLVKSNGKLAIIGFKKESNQPLILQNAQFDVIPEIEKIKDRSFIDGGSFFYKRKFMNTANGKNFLVGSLIEQSEYFDEIEERVEFPEIFVVSLISCALLERAEHLGHNFLTHPMVYVSLDLSLDRALIKALCSNDLLGLIVDKAEEQAGMHIFHCFGLLKNNAIVFRCIVKLAPLEMILNKEHA